jgi:pimeloyl-ACP methyl ester carboxylesterase
MQRRIANAAATGGAMAPRLVLVHGIGGPRRADVERGAWISALVEGARKAGHSGTADRLVDGTMADVVYAYYGDLFLRGQAQGTADGELAPDEAELLIELLAEVIQQHEGDPEVDADGLNRAISQLHPRGQPQGAMTPVRQVINAATTLLDAGPWRTSGQWAAGKLLVGDLAQVARYLARGEADASGRTLDARIRTVVAEALGPGSAVVVAHSLGTVVSFETLHEHHGDVPLWVTLGSPLTMRSVVLPRLRPAPPATPARVRRWLNYWDRDDIIAARPLLEADVLPNAVGVRPDSDRVDSDGVWVHSAVKYLAKADVAGPVMEALQLLETAP